MSKKRDISTAKAVITGIVSGALLVLAAALVITALKHGGAKKEASADNGNAEPNIRAEEAAVTEAPTSPPTETPGQPGGRGSWQPIPESVVSEITGTSYPSDGSAVISLDELAYLTIPYRDFDGGSQTGEMIVARDLADEVLDIFAELYEIGYPIERMRLVDKYGGSDFASIEENNTSAFNYRMSTDGGTSLSKHALGRAIDINPQINPYVNANGTGSHENAAEYWSRDIGTWSDETAKRAYIGPGTDIYRIFVEEHGWEWGGSWESYRDYQHFQKFN